MRLLVCEPYHGGSRRAWLEGLCALPGIEAERLTLPPRKWKWRLRAAALAFAEALPDGPCEALLATSLLDLAVLLGLGRKRLADARVLLYVHENQFVYPFRKREERDFQYLLAGLHSALAADAVGFNSAFNRDSFLAGIPGLLKLVPDLPEGLPGRLVERIAARSRVLPVPLDDELLALEPVREGPPLVVWNHRWEHDKNPAASFAALDDLAREGVPFRLAVLGQRFPRSPALFDDLPARFGERLVWCGTAARPAYLDWLRRASVVLSTADHEFFGLAVAEAVACGAWPVVPDRLAYPELWPPACRFASAAELRARLRDGLGRPPGALRARARSLTWAEQTPAYRAFLHGET